MSDTWRWLTGLFRNQASPDNSLTTSKELDEWLRYGGMETDSGIDVNVKTAEGVAAYAICVRVLSDAVAQLPLNLFRGGATAREQTKELALGDRRFRLLGSRPNAWQTRYEWIKLGMRDLLYRGNWYCLKIRGLNNVVMGLVRLHPDRVKVEQDPDTLQIRYTYSPPNGGEPKHYTRRDIMHVLKDTDDGVVGIDPIKAHRNAIGDMVAVRQHGSRFFKNATRLAGVLQREKGIKLSEGAAANILKDFEKMYAGNEEAHRTGILPEGFEFKPVSISMENAQWIETRRQTAQEMFGIMGIPPHKGGDKSGATFSNITDENRSFIVDSLQPWLVCLEQAFARDILNDDTQLYAKFDVSELLRGDFLSRQRGRQIQRRSGVINANEWRAGEDMNPRDDPGGDEYIIEKNMQADDGIDPEEQAQAITESVAARLRRIS